ncbi:hypothetical protein E4L95_18925 [Paracoccus liaowanqingii]|uniref:Peptidase inhibitor I78 n=1 Tax=Paracoccus liaowanqingii TaxID=2560053 RepID=A0A4Z1BHK1_9RHOB|nr:hypothetical protein [Paracoccus liaowanqingii]TGN48000.1 hypothetical protein E4L95_18925 [Paracoccus liaowanqingii]
MIRRQWATRAAALIVMAGTVAGCASSPNRMPPAGPAGMGPAPVQTYDSPAAPAYGVAPVAPVVADPYAAAAPYAPPYDISAPAAPDPVSGIAGLTERQPDLCKASDYARAVGQPSGVIPTLGLTRSFRVVEFRGIEPQDYDPNRIVFRLDATGTITQIDCG